MPVTIKLAASSKELDQLFRLRHRVMINEKQYMDPRNDERLCDRFDALACTSNLIALVEDEVIGAVRMVDDVGLGLPPEEYFDFSAHIPKGARVCAGGMILIAPEYRGRRRVISSLFVMSLYTSIARGMTHVISVVAPEAESAMLRCGFVPVAPWFSHPALKNVALPVVLDMRKLPSEISQLVQRHGSSFLMSSPVRRVFSKGEHLFQVGSPAECAYILVHGHVQVSAGEPRHPDEEAVVLGERDTGELFGLTPLLTGQPHHTSATALTDVDVIVLDKDTLWRQLEDPAIAKRVFATLGEHQAQDVMMLWQRRLADGAVLSSEHVHVF